MTIWLDGPAGRLEARLDEAVAPRAACVLAPPHPLHGGNLLSKVLHHAAIALTGLGTAVLRFNFRGAGASAGVHDGGPGERDDFRAALEFMAARHPGVALWAGGYSFGAWVAMTAAALDPRVELLIGIAPPVDLHDFSVVRSAHKPVFLVHGERDRIVPVGAVRTFYATLDEPRELVVIDMADHLFDGRATEVGDALTDLLAGELEAEERRRRS